MNDRYRYAADLDLRNVNDSHTFAVASVPAGSDVLDVGAADGSVARVLTRMGCRVWGVELDEAAARDATEWCEDVVVGDVEALDLAAALGRTFDVILFLDVLEHLRDPLAVLRASLDLLSEYGYVVISLPNVAHAAVRAQLLGGRFSYTEMGLLDRTHLRFFDSVSVREFLSDAGLVVLDESRVTFRLDATEIPVDVRSLDTETVDLLVDQPEAETYQFLYIAAPAGSAAAAEPPLLPARILQRELRATLDKLADVRGEEINVHRQDLLAELASLRQQSDSRRQVLRDLLVKIRENSEQMSAELSQPAN